MTSKFFSPLQFVLLWCLLFSFAASSDDLEELLNDTSNMALSETEEFLGRWDRLLTSLTKRDYEGSGLQLRKLKTEQGYVSPRKRDYIDLAYRAIHFSDSLEEEKNAFREEFQKANEHVITLERALKRHDLHASSVSERYNGRIPELTRNNLNKKQATLKGQLAKARTKRDRMQQEAKDFEGSRQAKLEQGVIGWISSSTTEDDYMASLLLAATFLDRVGESVEIRNLSGDLEVKRQEIEKANMIVEAIAKEVEPIAAAGQGDRANEKLQQMIARVTSSEQTEFVKKTALTKLEALSLKVAVARNTQREAEAAERATMVELDTRLIELEERLERAQETLGTLVQSIDGFADYSGSFKSEDERRETIVEFQEKLKLGVIAKEKLDNMVKVRADHAGILREVEVFTSSGITLSLPQRGRIANLQATAETAIALLGELNTGE